MACAESKILPREDHGHVRDICLREFSVGFLIGYFCRDRSSPPLAISRAQKAPPIPHRSRRLDTATLTVRLVRLSSRSDWRRCPSFATRSRGLFLPKRDATCSLCSHSFFKKPEHIALEVAGRMYACGLDGPRLNAGVFAFRRRRAQLLPNLAPLPLLS